MNDIEMKFAEFAADYFKSFPEGHVARSIECVRVCPAEDDFAHTLEGVSIDEDLDIKGRKYFSLHLFGGMQIALLSTIGFVPTLKNMMDQTDYVHKYLDDFLENLSNVWKKSNSMWGAA